MPPKAFQAASRQIHAGIDRLAEATAKANLARVLHWAGKVNEAGPLALEAMERLPGEPRLWLIAARYLHEQGDLATARRFFQRARAESPHDPRIDRAWHALQFARSDRP